VGGATGGATGGVLDLLDLLDFELLLAFFKTRAIPLSIISAEVLAMKQTVMKTRSALDENIIVLLLQSNLSTSG